MSGNVEAILTDTANGYGVAITSIKTADLGDELMYICNVNSSSYERALEYRLQIQSDLVSQLDEEGVARSIAFREDSQKVQSAPRSGEGLASQESLKLRSLIDSRSRTTFSIPSLKYRESPKASMEVVSSLKNLVIYGRRGVGKTALMREAYSYVRDNLGMPAVWINCQTFRELSPESVASAILSKIVEESLNYSDGDYCEKAKVIIDSLSTSTVEGGLHEVIPEVNSLLRARFNSTSFSLYCFLDDFYLLRVSEQPRILDLVFRALREATVALKISTVANLTRLFDYKDQTGLQIPHDAGKVDLDQTLEDPAETQAFLESILSPYLETSGVSSIDKLANPQSRGRLVLASGGVPRDYLSLISMSMDKALQRRENAKTIGTESVNAAAGDFALIRQNELEADAQSQGEGEVQQILRDREYLRTEIIENGRTTYFRVSKTDISGSDAERLGRLVDLRFIHLVWKEFSDKKGSGERFDAYTLSLSEFSESRLFRRLQILDVEKGAWIKKMTGNSREAIVLDRKGLRNTLVAAPVLYPFD